MKQLLCLTLIVLAGTVPSLAQKVIRGVVSDAETGETLPAANISIEGTYRGTISNPNGQYTLSIPDSLLPATVMIRYIGYHSGQLVIRQKSSERQDIALRPAITELGEIVVTDEDPALRIMREVIRRKQEWRRNLQTYRAEAYTRQTLANDTSIVMITETVSEAFWDKGKGHREVLKSRRQTANIREADNFAGVSYLPNFYDDNIGIAGFDLVGVTHPDALKYYDFRLVNRHRIDERLVYEIEVVPARKLQPLFEGTIHVLDGEYALLEVRLRPNEVVKFPPPVKSFNSYYEQQFNNFGQNYWLPADVRIDGTIKISMVGLEFPLIQFRQLSRITNYQVNVPLPDSLYESEQLLTVDSTAAAGDTLRITSVEAVPLSQEEKQAYASLDSTASLEKAFRPSGFLARFVDDEEEEGRSGGPGFMSRIPGEVVPQLRFNRVDELYAGLGYRISLNDRLRLNINGGYSTGYKRWIYGGGFGYTYLSASTLTGSVGLAYHAGSDTRYSSHRFDPVLTSIANLLGGSNYFDYFRSEGIRAHSGIRLRRHPVSVEVAYTSEKHSSLAATSSYDLLGRQNGLGINPPVDEGRLHAVGLEVGYNLAEDGFLAGVFTGIKRIRAGFEYASPKLGSDFDYATYRMEFDWSFPTFYRRRLFPNTLDVNLKAGTYSGALPLQKSGVVDVALGYFSPFGVLKTVRNRPYEGEQYLSLMAEHNFRTIPFEALGWRFASEKNIGLIVFGGMAKTWFSESRSNRLANLYGFTPHTTDDLHMEAGLSINGLFGLLRVDVAARLDRPAYLVSFSLARMF